MDRIPELQRYVDETVRCSHADIHIMDLKEGILMVELRGSCSGCPGAASTVEELLHGSLMEAFPEIKGIMVDQRVGGEILDFAKKLLGGKDDRE